MEQQVEPHRGTTVVVLGIIGLLGIRVCGIIAWVMANKDNSKMLAGTMDPAGLQQTKGGKICGIISVCLIPVDIILIVVFAGLIISILGIAAELPSEGIFE